MNATGKAELRWEDGRLYTLGGRCLECDVTLDEACQLYRNYAVIVRITS